MHYIHCLNNISPHGTDLLDENYKLTDDLSKASAVLVRSAAMHEMQFPPDLLAIARAGAGVNNIPLERCTTEGIVVFNAPGANANAVKEIVVCSLLLGSRDIIGGIEWCRANAEDPNLVKTVEKAKSAFAGREIQGKRLGVIGLGAVGALVANAGIDLGMEVYGYDPYVSVDAAWHLSRSVHHSATLDEVLSHCDYLSIHVPAIEATIGMIDERACSLMKDGAVLLNFSRDTLVKNDAMQAALASGKVHAYITDFPLPEVMTMHGAIVMPHLGASTVEAEDNCAKMAVRQMMNYLENGTIVNSVNYPACTMGACLTTGGRVAIMHQNIPNMIGKITNIFGDANINIDKMENHARKDAAYTLIDLVETVPDEVVKRLAALEGVHRARALCQHL